MSIDPILKDLAVCVENNDINASKFYSKHPLTESLRQKLYVLKRSGYLVIDSGDDRICDIAPTQKLIALAQSIS